ncbi:MAG: WbqC family protein [Deltaproteobacteria bacterium]|nr:WbqC family protein [Deltaproteobacteria bacterium]
MIISAHQPAYLPWLGYLHKILLCDVFVIMDDVQFEKNSFINRNRIWQNGHEVMLTIPVATKGYQEKTINQLLVSDLVWIKKHLKSIEQSYKKAPYFEPVFGLLESGYHQADMRLVSYTHDLTFRILDYLGIKTKIQLASELDIESKKLDYVIEMTQKLDGEIFVFGTLGRDYVDLARFHQASLRAYFQDYHHPVYRQMSGAFTPCLSVVDLLFNEPKDNIIQIIMQNNATSTQVREQAA